MIFWIVIILGILASSILSQVSFKFTKILESASSSKGGMTETLILICAPIFIMVWLYMIFVKKEYLKALFMQIIIFPITYKATSVFAINAFVDQTGYIQKVSITTFMLIILFCILIYKKKIKRLNNKSWRLFERILLSYAIILTITQLFNHSPSSALWLSIGGIWQYIIIFYALSSLVTSFNKLLLLYKSMLGFVIVNILMRIFAEKQIFVQSLNDEYTRVGAGSMGPAVSYGGYLCLIITIGLLLYRLEQKKAYVLVIVIFLIELINTFTRGAILSLTFLVFLYIPKSERRIFYKISAVLVIIVISIGDIVWEYMSIRGMVFSSKIFQIGNVMVRADLLKTYFENYFSFSLIGHGIGKFTLVPNLYNIEIPAHNILVALYDQAGAIVLLIFLTLFIYSFYLNIKNIRNNYDRQSSIMSVYIAIALFQWFFFANTTSTYLNVYYPYEASSIFWILLFSSPIIHTLSKIIPNNN